MTTLAETLRGDCVFVNLGAGGDRDHRLPAELRQAVTLVEIDAAEAARGGAPYHARHRIQRVVAGQAGTRTFRVNRFVSCSSLRAPDPALIACYGLERYFVVTAEQSVECVTLPMCLQELGVDHVDFLKTDLEGEDADVLHSMEPYFPRVLAIQAELRFQPFYEGEPYFHEVVAYLNDRGFELIGLNPEYWRPAMPEATRYPDGRIVWADVLLLRRWDTLPTEPAARAVAVAKQIVVLSMLQRRGYARYLAERTRGDFPAAWLPMIERLTRPPTLLQRVQRWRPWLGRVRRRLRGDFSLSHVATW